MFPAEEGKNNDVVLELNSPKSNGIFATNQTPTPTGLFQNCEEYGIFEDLKHVNPFEEIFRHAVEEKKCKSTTTEKPQTDEESLHTPQVFPQLDQGPNETKDTLISRTQSVNSDLTTPTPAVTNELESKVSATTSKAVQSSSTTKKYRAIAEKPATAVSNAPLPTVTNAATISGTAIPIQTVKPLFKVNTHLKPAVSCTPTCTVTSPSSASLTPTSQLPIKERLKVILNNNKSQRAIASACTTQVHSSLATSSSVRKRNGASASGKYDERCLERRRAAATRYRHKMREEHKDLKKRNSELQSENEKLRARVLELEKQLAQKPVATSAANVPLQIPPSSIHLIMNIPKLFVPANGPPLLHNPITYSLEKK